MNAPARTPAKPRRSDERDLHIAIVHYLRRVMPADITWWHCPSGEHRDIRTAQKLKAMGTIPGVADLNFVLPGGFAAFIELKADKGRLSPAQQAFREAVEGLGARFAECRSLVDVEATLTAWGVQLKGRLS